MGKRGKAATLAPDFALEVYEQRLPDNGEDGYYYALGATESVVAAFDGSGGSGARRYEKWQGKTGAYLASRVMAGAVCDWFAAGDAQLPAIEAAELLKRRAACYLAAAKEACGTTSRVRGTLTKEFPTTCSVAALRQGDAGSEVLSLNAGDSRCYLLDGQGLHQISQDDLRDLDAFENLSADGAMTNVVNASGRFAIHAHVVPISGPCVVFAATDGCFGYLPTPMEFEYLLLSTLEAARSPQDWEQRLHDAFAAVAGDDFTLCGVAVGFGSFTALKTVFDARRTELYQRFIQDIGQKSLDEKRALWQRYREGYYVFAPQS